VPRPPHAHPSRAVADPSRRAAARTAAMRRGRGPVAYLAVLLAILLAVGAAVVAALWSGLLTTGPDGAAGPATVERVVDGDTIVVAVAGEHETVRLIGIDTPESVARDRPDECFGAEASHRLAELLPPGTAVRLTRDVEPRDMYDRLLAYVFRGADGLFVNAAQVAEGYAEAKDYPPNVTYRDDFEAAEATARRAGRGLWAACGGPDVPIAAARRPPP
jgi:micrococcal nuclease